MKTQTIINKILFISIVLSIFLFSCNSRRNRKLENTINKIINEKKELADKNEKDYVIFDIKEMTDFEWTKMYLVLGTTYSDMSKISEIAGFDVKKELPLDMSATTYYFLFMNKEKFVSYIKLDYWGCDVFKPENNSQDTSFFYNIYSVYSIDTIFLKKDAKFVLAKIRKDEDKDSFSHTFIQMKYLNKYPFNEFFIYKKGDSIPLYYRKEVEKQKEQMLIKDTVNLDIVENSN